VNKFLPLKIIASFAIFAGLILASIPLDALLIKNLLSAKNSLIFCILSLLIDAQQPTIFFITAAALIKIFGQPSWGDIGFRIHYIDSVLGLATFVFMAVVYTVLKDYMPLYSKLLLRGTEWMVFGTMLISSLIIAFGEEMFFRGVVQTFYTNIFRPHWGILITAGFFTLIHFLFNNSLPTSLAIFLLGLGLGIAYYFTKRIWTPIFIHIGFNLAGMVLPR